VKSVIKIVHWRLKKVKNALYFGIKVCIPKRKLYGLLPKDKQERKKVGVTLDHLRVEVGCPLQCHFHGTRHGEGSEQIIFFVDSNNSLVR
jgi:hypothetical protein